MDGRKARQFIALNFEIIVKEIDANNGCTPMPPKRRHSVHPTVQRKDNRNKHLFVNAFNIIETIFFYQLNSFIMNGSSKYFVNIITLQRVVNNLPVSGVRKNAIMPSG